MSLEVNEVESFDELPEGTRLLAGIGHPFCKLFEPKFINATNSGAVEEHKGVSVISFHYSPEGFVYRVRSEVGSVFVKYSSPKWSHGQPTGLVNSPGSLLHGSVVKSLDSERRGAADFFTGRPSAYLNRPIDHEFAKLFASIGAGAFRGSFFLDNGLVSKLLKVEGGRFAAG